MVKVIDYSDIIDKIKVEYDTDPINPLEDDDWAAHELMKVDPYEYPDVKEARGYQYNSYDKHSIIVPKEGGGEYEYARAKGASKQVAREYEASNLQHRINFIKKVLDGKYESYGLSFDNTEDNKDFDTVWYGTPDIEESVWGFTDDSINEGKEEVAATVVRALEAAGWTVNGKPDDKASYRRACIHYYQTMFTWSGDTHNDGHRYRKPTFANFGEWYDAQAKS